MKILIHTCCAPCLIYPHKRLIEEGFCVESFYYNPNIHPQDEYLRRKQQVENYTKETGIKMHDGRYEIKEFFRQVNPVRDRTPKVSDGCLWQPISNGVNQKEDAPLRCNLCWQLRLGETARFAKENNFDFFTTTLLVSPYQNHETLKETGEECAKKYDVEFYYEDFRKGYQESVAESKNRNMYRQKYCGCLYSMKSL